ncbi:MAG TPA: GNAT family N-acetyltransferase [Ignavibacteriaceae bacterium]|nr:GNAT family N-acetyltransferase [Ignavibacteriaceae bacterium]
MNYKVKHDKENQQFVANVEGKDAYLRYLIKGDKKIDFHHTYVPNELRGKGLAAEVVKEGFKYAEENNLKVIPTCPYIHTFLKKYPEYEKFIN